MTVKCKSNNNTHGWLFAGHRCQARNDRAWAGGRGTVGARKGQVYYEITVADEGLCRVGWSTRQASLDLGNEPISFGFGGTGAAPYSDAWQAACVTALTLCVWPTDFATVTALMRVGLGCRFV